MAVPNHEHSPVSGVPAANLLQPQAKQTPLDQVCSGSVGPVTQEIQIPSTAPNVGTVGTHDKHINVSFLPNPGKNLPSTSKDVVLGRHCL